jgi:molybdopterin synthase sulfur carrier subunit
MLRLRFFASIRERLGRAELTVPFDPGAARVDALVARLDAVELPGCAVVLLADNTVFARNRTVCGRDTLLSEGDELAFYPPVTGG